MLFAMARTRSPLPPAPRARPGSYSVAVYEAPRENERMLARMIGAHKGTVPEKLRPRKIDSFTVEAPTMDKARKAVAKRMADKGLPVRAINRGKREFIVYVPHPEDRNHGTTNPPA